MNTHILINNSKTTAPFCVIRVIRVGYGYLVIGCRNVVEGISAIAAGFGITGEYIARLFV